MTSEPPELRIVPYSAQRHGDQQWHVVKNVFLEYGFPFDENDYDIDLKFPAQHYRSGWFWVAEDGAGRVRGCVGLSDEGGGVFELHRLYMEASARRGGMGRQLVETVIDAARDAGARELVLYSDVAFSDAHRLYRRCGFRNHRFRYAPDPWQSREWGFTMTFRGDR